jgi:hypothetical protein
VVDDGEQCDDGPQNSNRIPDACRLDCKAPACGDGVIDEGEECDDDRFDCTRCKRCVAPRDGLRVDGDVRLCPGRYTLRDGGPAGLIQVAGNDLLLDCRGAVIESKPRQASKPKLRAGLVRPGIRGRRAGRTPSAGAGRAPASGATLRQGTGIVITGRGVTLLGCTLHGFTTALDLRNAAGASVVDADLCDNTTAVRGAPGRNQGAHNRCAGAVPWHEGGAPRCSTPCR